MGNEVMWICIRIHHAVLNHTNQFLQDDTYINMQDDPNHQDLCMQIQ
jgi:hypothetical protein